MTESSRVSLAALVAQPVSIDIGNAKLNIAPMGWYQAAIALQHLLPVLSAMPAVSAEMGGRTEDRVAVWAGVVVTYREEIAAFCSEASGLPVAQVKALLPVHMVELVMGLVEVNAEFFAQNVPGLVAGSIDRMKRLSERWAPVVANAEAAHGASAPLQ